MNPADDGEAVQDTPLLTIAQAARRLNVPESWLRDKVTARKVPHRRLGKHVRFGEDDLDQIVEQARQVPRGTVRRGAYVHRSGMSG